MQPETLGDVKFKKLVHEFKSIYSALPDDVIRNCIKQYGSDTARCNDILCSEAERLALHGGPAYARVMTPRQHRRFSLKALLDQQMQRHLVLREEYQKDLQLLSSLKDDEVGLEAALELKQQSILEDITVEKSKFVKEEVNSLEESCEELKNKISLLCQERIQLSRKSSEDSSAFRGPCGLSSDPSPVGGEAESEGWACSVCTLENHGALKRCEACDMPRFMTGTADAGLIPHLDSECFCHPQQWPQPDSSSIPRDCI